MPNVFANDIQIEYETFGEPSSPALLLIAGIGGQMIGWDEELCKKWAQKGLYVIRFDNRDVGLSTKMEEAGVPDLAAVAKAINNGEKVNVPYTIGDMADDAVEIALCNLADQAGTAQKQMNASPAATRSGHQQARTVDRCRRARHRHGYISPSSA